MIFLIKNKSAILGSAYWDKFNWEIDFLGPLHCSRLMVSYLFHFTLHNWLFLFEKAQNLIFPVVQYFDISVFKLLSATLPTSRTLLCAISDIFTKCFVSMGHLYTPPHPTPPVVCPCFLKTNCYLLLSGFGV